ncbi:MAG: hypothetical protein K2Y71_29195 [Xanthobacteraceae bacterium]|nr:hypothetical protein [Xanthobacteraceae bacterium]
MEALLGLLRLALDNGWRLALLIVAFCGLALAAPKVGLALPAQVGEWAGAGLIFGIAVLVASMVTRAFGAAATRWRRTGREMDEAADVFANLSTLSPDELQAFVEMLESRAPRFEVHIMSVAYPLLRKGILRAVRQVAGVNWLCEFHPAIAHCRDSLLTEAQAALNQRGRGF